MKGITFEIGQDGVGVLTINRPQARNALNWEAMYAFASTVESAHRATTIRAMVVTGADGAFCAGGDLFELDQYPTHQDGHRLAAVMGDALHGLEALHVPTVAAMEGPAIGGGAEIALACDMRVMAESAILGLTHVRLGISPAWGGGQRLLRLAGYARALEWLTEGRVLSAEEAREHGLANRLVPTGTALTEAMAMARAFASRDPAAVKAVKRLLLAGVSTPTSPAFAAERAEFPALWASPAHLEASASFVARKNHKPR